MNELLAIAVIVIVVDTDIVCFEFSEIVLVLVVVILHFLAILLPLLLRLYDRLSRSDQFSRC